MSRDTGAKERIIEAARAVLAKRGYEDASVKEISRAAKVAPGLVHYYFKNKDQLLVAVCEAASAAQAERNQTLGKQLPRDAFAAAALKEAERRASEDPTWYRLRYELFALGLRNAALRPSVAQLLAAGRARIGAVIERVGTPRGIEPQAFAALLLAVFDGLGLQKVVDPTFDVRAAYAAFEKLL